MSNVLRSKDGHRGAEVYEIAGQPGVYRTRVEKYPEHSEAASGWFGGRVLWGHDKTSKSEALALAGQWVNAAVLPESERQERVYVMAGEKVPESRMKDWHNSRGIPWGSPFTGPEPIVAGRMQHPDRMNLSVHLANEHAIESDDAPRGIETEHMHAHTFGLFRKGQEHYHDQEKRRQ